MPTFYNAHHAQISFTNSELETWIRRLRILYQIDKGRNYGEVIDCILSILQFVPATLLLPLVHVTMETCTSDEIMFNDIARARMCALEEWVTDGNSYRPVSLPECYRAMSLSAMGTAQQTTTTTVEVAAEEETTFQSTIITVSDNDEPGATHGFNITD